MDIQLPLNHVKNWIKLVFFATCLVDKLGSPHPFCIDIKPSNNLIKGEYIVQGGFILHKSPLNCAIVFKCVHCFHAFPNGGVLLFMCALKLVDNAKGSKMPQNM